MTWVRRQKSQQVGALALSLVSTVTSGTVSFPILGARGPRYKLSGGITRQGDRRPEDAVKGPRGGGDGGQRSVRARRCTPGRTPGEAGHLGPSSNPACAADSLRTRRRATSQFRERDAGCAGLSYRQARRTTVGGSRTNRRPRCGAARTRAHHRPARPARPGLDGSQRPRPAPGMRSSARTRRRAEAAVARRAGPPASASPSGPGPSTACREPHASADGHRFPALTATSAAGSRPLLRLRPAPAASTSAHLPAVGQRRHQPTSAGTRQWRPGRRVGAEGAHAAAGAAMSQERVGLRQG